MPLAWLLAPPVALSLELLNLMTNNKRLYCAAPSVNVRICMNIEQGMGGTMCLSTS